MNLKNIGKNIKELRLNKGLTQAQLAEIANISNVHMSHIETGTVSMSLDSLLCICNGLDTTPDRILIGEYKLSSQSAPNLLEQCVQELTSDENKLIVEIAKLLQKNKVNRNDC
ncbi:MAG: helix-turn-helix transcriptional regulator [Clostridia bacterium]|nr:helix-turn-helix transcriptional regulator [Clostridia bacterium]